jgi:hypothetical protein
MTLGTVLCQRIGLPMGTAVAGAPSWPSPGPIDQ